MQTKTKTVQLFILEALAEKGVGHLFSCKKEVLPSTVAANALNLALDYTSVNPFSALIIDKKSVSACAKNVKQRPVLIIDIIEKESASNPELKKVCATRGKIYSKEDLHNLDRLIDACIKNEEPVYLQILKSCLNQEVNDTSLEENHDNDFAKSEILKEIASILKESDHPVIVIGEQVKRFNVSQAVLEFAEKYHIPMTQTDNARGTIEESHPLYVGSFSTFKDTELADIQDTVFVLGCSKETEALQDYLEDKQVIFAGSKEIKIGHHQWQDLCFTNFLESLAATEYNLRFRCDFSAAIDQVVPDKNCHKTVTIDSILKLLSQYLKPNHCLILEASDVTLPEELFIGERGYIKTESALSALSIVNLCLPNKQPVVIAPKASYVGQNTQNAIIITYDTNKKKMPESVTLGKFCLKVVEEGQKVTTNQNLNKALESAFEGKISRIETAQ